MAEVGASTYSTRAAARILAVSPDRIRYWVKQRLVKPAAKRGRRFRFAFHDLILMRMAALREGEADLAGPLRHLLGAAVLVPGNAEVHRRLGLLYRKRDENEHALQSFIRAVECDPVSV